MNDLVSRVKGMIATPADEWRKIAREPIELVPVFTRYVMILAALPAIATFLLLVLFIPVTAFTSALVSYILTLVGVFVISKIIELLAPSFGGPQDADAALKLAAFAPTAGWVAGITLIIPFIGPLLALIGAFYSLYVLYLGVPIVMRVPQEKAFVFTLSVIGVAIVVNIAVRLLTGIFV